ncbi:MAG: hypothetical protein OXL96_21135 [Candidatus Poribacteria bacterium]|nr:hypothetical protein [Candidatus Poribacteria bacterium]
MNWKLRKLFELVKDKGKSVQEVYALIPGSQAVYERSIRKALKDNPPEAFGAHFYTWLEACLGEAPDKIVVEVEKPDGLCYFEVAVSIDGAGMVTFGDATEVEYELVTKAKNEARQFLESLENLPRNKQYNEQYSAAMRLDESSETAYLSVDFAGQADVRNRNGRIYTAECLQEAVEELQDRLPLPFGTVHEDQTDLGKVAGLIHEVAFDAETGKVSIPKIELLDTTSGKDLKEIIDKEVAVEVSHRAVGQGYVDTDELTGEETEYVTWLRYEGIDTVWPGRSGFGNTNLQPKTEGHEPTPSGSEPTRSREGNPSQHQQGGQLTEERIVALVGQSVHAALTPYQERMQQQLDAQNEQQAKRALKTIANETIEDVLLQYPNFGDVEKEEIRRVGTDVDRLYERVSSNPSDRASIKLAQERMVAGVVETFSQMHAAYKLDAKQMPENRRPGTRYINSYGGVTHVDEVIAHSPLDSAEVNRVVNTAYERLVPKGFMRNQLEAQRGHENFQEHAKMLDAYMHTAAPKIQREIDMGLKWETVQADIDVPVSITSMYIELVAWKMLTAIPYLQLHPMVALLENIPIQEFTSAFGKNAGLHKWADASSIAEGADRRNSSLKYGNHVLAASAQKYATTYTQESLATIRGTVMDITVDIVALCGRDLADLIDGMAWELQVNEALALDTVTVTNEVLGTGDNSKTKFTADHAGWITYEWIVVKNSDGNPTRSYPQRLFPDYDNHEQTATGITRPKIQVTDDAGDSEEYDYAVRADGTIDASKDWYFDGADGTITLTAAGVTKLATDDLRVSYSYSKNVEVWDATVPSGMTFKEHLWDLRFAISRARNKVITRNYTPQFIAWPFSVKDQVVGGQNFAADGLTNVDVVNAMNDATNYVGMDPVYSANFPDKYALVAERNYMLYGIHTPYTMSAPQYIDKTGDPFLHGTQFAGAAVPKEEKASVIVLKNFKI